MNPWNMLEIIHEDERDGFGMRGGDELESAYRKGCEHGYRKAMEEMRGGMGFREGGYGGGSSRMGERFDYPSYPYMDEMGERRRRRANGQWY